MKQTRHVLGMLWAVLTLPSVFLTFLYFFASSVGQIQNGCPPNCPGAPLYIAVAFGWAPLIYLLGAVAGLSESGRVRLEAARLSGVWDVFIFAPIVILVLEFMVFLSL